MFFLMTITLTLLFLDKLEKRFLSLGFGGMVNGRTSHCFPLNGNSRDPYCYGIEGIIDAYYSSLEHGMFVIFNNNFRINSLK